MSLPKKVRSPVPDWAIGDSITAGRLQKKTDAIRVLQRAVGLKQVTPPPSGNAEVGPLESAEYVSSTETTVEVPIYDVADPETQIGTLTEARFTSITWRITRDGETFDIAFEMPP